MNVYHITLEGKRLVIICGQDIGDAITKLGKNLTKFSEYRGNQFKILKIELIEDYNGIEIESIFYDEARGG